MSALKKRQPLQLNLNVLGSVRLPWVKDCSLDNLGEETCIAYFNDVLCVSRHQKREKHMISSSLLLCNSLHNLLFTLNTRFQVIRLKSSAVLALRMLKGEPCIGLAVNPALEASSLLKIKVHLLQVRCQPSSLVEVLISHLYCNSKCHKQCFPVGWNATH